MISLVEREERVERIGMDDCVDELRKLAAEVGQIAYFVHNPVGLLINFGSYKFERRTITA